MDPDPTLQVSLGEEEACTHRDTGVHTCTENRTTLWRGSKRAATWRPRRETPEETAQLAPLPWTPRRQNCEKINDCFVSLPVYGILLWQPKRTNTLYYFCNLFSCTYRYIVEKSKCKIHYLPLLHIVNQKFNIQKLKIKKGMIYKYTKMHACSHNDSYWKNEAFNMPLPFKLPLSCVLVTAGVWGELLRSGSRSSQPPCQPVADNANVTNLLP